MSLNPPTDDRHDLIVSPGSRIWLGGNNVACRMLLEPLVAHCQRPPTGVLDEALIAPRSADEAVYFAGKLLARLVSGGLMWIVFAEPPEPADVVAGLTRDRLCAVLTAFGAAESGRIRLPKGLGVLGLRVL